MSRGIQDNLNYLIDMIDLVEIIASIEEYKKARNMSPTDAVLGEIVAEVDKKIKPELRKLCMDGKIDWCETLNTFAFLTKK